MDFDTCSIDFGWVSMGFHFIFNGFRMVCNAFSIAFGLFYNGLSYVSVGLNGLPYVFCWATLCFLMDPLIILLVSPLFSIGFRLLSYGPPPLFYGFSLAF